MSKIGSEEYVGRRLRFRDLQVFFAVVEYGSMAKAATKLAMTQPAVSEIIASLEDMFGVRLFDRTPHGAEPTAYGRVLLDRGRAAFDELKQGIRSIGFIADRNVGELNIGCPGSVAAAIFPVIIERFSRRYPGVVLHFDEVTSPSTEFPGLRQRKHDLVLARVAMPLRDTDELNVEVLFDDPLLVTADARSEWGRRRKINVAQLVDARWILTAPDTWVYRSVSDAFQAHGLPMPKVSFTTLSALLRIDLLTRGPFVTALPTSVLRLNAGRQTLKVLPVDLQVQGYPVAILTLKNRLLTPLAMAFIDTVRDVSRLMVTKPA